MKLAWIAALALAIGCGPARPKPSSSPRVDFSDWPTGETVQVGPCEVVLPAGLDLTRRAKILDAIAVITADWESEEGKLPPTTVAVTDASPGCDVYGIPVGGNYGGCWRGDRFIIINACSDTCAFLRHELGHRVYALYGHADARFAHWNDRMQALFLELEARP